MIKEKVKEHWKNIKTWTKEHKKAIICGSLLVGLGAVAAVVKASGNKSCEDTQDEVCGDLATEKTDDEEDYDDYKDIDRYVLDTELVDQLPPGTYDLFDMYENRRVDYVIKEKN